MLGLYTNSREDNSGKQQEKDRERTSHFMSDKVQSPYAADVEGCMRCDYDRLF